MAAAGLAAGVFATVASAGPPTITSVSCMDGGQTTLTFKGNPLSIDFEWFSSGGNGVYGHTSTVVGGMAGHTLSVSTPTPDSVSSVEFTLEYTIHYKPYGNGIDQTVNCIAAQSETECLKSNHTFSTDPATDETTAFSSSGDTFLWSCDGSTAFTYDAYNNIFNDCSADAHDLGFADNEFSNPPDYTVFTCATY